MQPSGKPGLLLDSLVRGIIGSLVVGLIALKLPQVLGGGYGWVQLAINGHLAALLQSGLALDLPDGSQLTASKVLPQPAYLSET